MKLIMCESVRDITQQHKRETPFQVRAYLLKMRYSLDHHITWCCESHAGITLGLYLLHTYSISTF